MKRIVIALFIVFFSNPVEIIAQNPDSVDLKKEFEKIEAEINRVYQNAVLRDKKSDKLSEEIETYYNKQLRQLENLQTLLKKHSDEYQNINNSLQEIEEVASSNTSKIWGFEVRNHLVQFVLLGLLIFLIIFVVRFRRQSLDYLLSRANSLSDQNDIIIEKADELMSIKKTLKDLIIAQKKKQKIERKKYREIRKEKKKKKK